MPKIKIIILLITIIANSLYSYNGDKGDAILKEIQILRSDMNKRFEQVDKRFEQVDKRFEQVDKRFEQTDKRLNFMQNILYALMGLIFASPFIAIYLKEKQETQAKKDHDDTKAMVFVLREMAKDDEKLTRTLQSASLL